MLSLRQLSRQLPRSVARLTSTAARQPLRTPAFAAAKTAAHFSTSLFRRQGASYHFAPSLVHRSLCFVRCYHPGTCCQAELGDRPREGAASGRQLPLQLPRVHRQQRVQDRRQAWPRGGPPHQIIRRREVRLPVSRSRHQLANMQSTASRLPSPLPTSTLTTRRPTPKTPPCTEMRTVPSIWKASLEVPTPRVP
jgi:hypothetical protein